MTYSLQPELNTVCCSFNSFLGKCIAGIKNEKRQIVLA